jgi:hypothetical protein
VKTRTYYVHQERRQVHNVGDVALALTPTEFRLAYALALVRSGRTAEAEPVFRRLIARR